MQYTLIGPYMFSVKYDLRFYIVYSLCEGKEKCFFNDTVILREFTALKLGERNVSTDPRI